MKGVCGKPEETANVVKVLVEKFDIKPIGSVEEDIATMISGN